MSDEDSLVATRSKRSNAGTRLKYLIELEERASDVQESVTAIINDEDENVNLLFQEDDDDQEFFGEDETDDEEVEDGDEESTNKDEDNKKRSYESDDEVEQVNSDEVLSDSDISMSDPDESEGEKELQKQEKMKQRKIKKKQSAVPTIKKPKINETPKAKTPKGLTSSDSLLLSMRRSSSRAIAVENKEALVLKLKENEKKRAKSAPIVRVKHVDLTQEEKLSEAIETEKANILSLQQFRDQEIVKKERQKQLLLLRKVRLKNVIRLISNERLITPLDEVIEARHVHELINSRSRKKLGRKKKITKETEVRRLPGEVDTELPIVKQELEQKRIQEEQEIKANSKEEIIDAKYVGRADDNSNQNLDVEIDKSNIPETQEQMDDSNQVQNKENFNDLKKEVEKEDEPGDSLDNNDLSKGMAESNKDVDKINNIGVKTENNQPSGESSILLDEMASKNNIKSMPENNAVEMSIDEEQNTNESPKNKFSKEANLGNPLELEEQPVNDNKDTIENDMQKTETESSEAKEEKRVKFADDLEEEQGEGTEQYDTKHSTPDTEIGAIPEIFEGPPQRVARHMIYLIDFEIEKDQHYNLDDSNIKSMLFGPQSLLPASRRFKDLKTILRIGEVENPYAPVKQEKDELFEPVSELNEDNAMFDELKRLPRLGITQTIVEEVEEDTQEENDAIVLKTEAPTGIYLPNGNKKVCLVSGTEVKYFDPSNGIPYSSVETYRFLKIIEQGNVPWYSIGEIDNDNGPVELYLGSRDCTEKHAKGVPEGFEG